MRKKKVEFVKSPPDEFQLSSSSRYVRQEQGDFQPMMTDVLMSPVDATRHSKNEEPAQHELLFFEEEQQARKTKKKIFLSRRQRRKLFPSSIECKVVSTANFTSLSDDDERLPSSSTANLRPTALIHPLNSSSSGSSSSHSSTARNLSSSSPQETMAPRGVTTPSLSPADYCFYLRRHVHLQVKDGSSDSSDSDGDTSHQHHNTTPHQYRVRPPSHPTSSSSSSNSHHHYNHQHAKQAHGKLHSVTSSLSSGLESPSVSELLSSLVQDLKNVPSG